MSSRPAALLALTVSSCVNAAAFETNREPWGKVDGRNVYLYTVTNANGMVLKMTNYGARITELHVPDRSGNLDDVVLGFDNLEQYMQPNQSIGATIGRYTNRIRGAKFKIDGKTYQLTKNEGENNIHGGGEFENVVWDSEIVEVENGTGLRFRYLSPDGSHGFPGNLESTVTYILKQDNAIEVTFEATTDKATHVNFTQHSYFNLNGARATIHEHVARIDADRYLVLDEVFVTGEIGDLNGKAWDLSSPTRLGDNMGDIPLGGYHHNYVTNNAPRELGVVAVVEDPESGRRLTVSTTQPGVTFYAAMGLNSDIVGKYGIAYEPYIAFCIETQHHIDAANHPNFPSTLLRPGETYDETAIYDFGADIGR